MKLYLIAGGNLSREEFFFRVREALEGGVDWVQVRVKDPEESRSITREIKKLKEYFNFKLIVNDFPDVALKAGADGVHLGEGDPSPGEVRKFFKGIIGVSCYDDLSRARRAQEAGADYVAFGSLFPTETKKNYRIVKPQVILEARRVLKVPICVIGGIKRENIDQVLSLRPDMIAISSAIFLAPSPRREASFFKRKMLYYLSSKPLKEGK